MILLICLHCLSTPNCTKQFQPSTGISSLPPTLPHFTSLSALFVSAHSLATLHPSQFSLCLCLQHCHTSSLTLTDPCRFMLPLEKLCSNVLPFLVLLCVWKVVNFSTILIVNIAGSRLYNQRMKMLKVCCNTGDVCTEYLL